MKSSIDTHMGSIRINDDVIAQYAGTVANECFGIVGMASVNVKEDLVRILKKDNVNRGITVKNEGGKLVLDFHVIVAYGVNIPAVTENLVNNVRYKVEEYTGLEVVKINIYGEGVRVID